ncbi:MAG: Lon protease [candidate division TM6 bacterium GW2011_GWF2_38_10]|nr:MAG: Lon protease [candidate division TM6 bacterium GW2011_GWF2_38_10]
MIERPMEENIIVGAPRYCPVLPLKNLVALPKSIVPVVVGREVSIAAVEYAMAHNKKEIFITAQQSPDIDIPTGDDLYVHGTRGVILQVVKLQNGTLKILVEGVTRARIASIEQEAPFIGVMLEELSSQEIKHAPTLKSLWKELLGLFKEYIGLNEKLSSDLLGLFRGPEDLDFLCDTIAVHVSFTFTEKQALIELVDLKERALLVTEFLKREVDNLRTDKTIRKRVQSQVEKHQRDYYLTEQLRAIQRELGRDDAAQEIEEIRKKAKKIKMSAEALEKVESELRRLEQMPPMSPEAAVARNYVDWLITIPWHEKSKDTVSLQKAEQLLDDSHAGMKKPKERVVEFLAARKYAKENLKHAPIICLVGPPGVGKTSFAQSIAEALGRPMVRISLGGVRDEAEIRGHRRTYIGAMPGKIIQSMKRIKVMNPVIVLDEIDKMSMDFRGDPSSALLEVLDPEQNKNFVDHFLEVEYDLSNVMFIATANVGENIPYPLLDRMEVIYLNGYTEAEKLEIAKKFLIPKHLQEHALSSEKVVLSDLVLKSMIEDFTKEAGVRQLERYIAKIMRKCIQVLLANKKVKSVEVTHDMLEKWFGVPPFRREDRKRVDATGLATGLAWTEVGGDVLEIEVTVLKGKGGLTLTGQLGEVMQESAQAAMSYLRSRAKDLGLKENFYADLDVHVHIPEGAIPKDGPSAGITIATAVMSALTQIPVKCTVAMTGEITLRGRVLPVGGLKEKLLAATRFGIKQVIVSKQNAKDIKEFVHELDPSLTIAYVETMDEVAALALEKNPFIAHDKKVIKPSNADKLKKPARGKKIKGKK